MDAIIWLGIVIVLIIIEIVTLGLPLSGLPAERWRLYRGAFGGGSPIQAALFLAVSVLLLLFTRPLAVRYLNRNRTLTNVESMIGRQGVVLEAIDNLREQGQVRIGGLEWMARAAEDTDKIPEGTAVEVVKIDGVKAIVKRK